MSKEILELLKETLNRIASFGLGLHGAAIAFYAIFSTAPLIIILIWITTTILGEQMGQAEFQETMESIVGPDLTDSIDDVVESTNQGTSGVWSTLVAIFTLLFGATTLLSQVKATLNRIWGIKDPQISTVWWYVWDRLKGLLFIGSLSLLFMAGLISESLIFGLGNLLIPIIGDQNVLLIQFSNRVLNIILAFTFFTALFRILPDLNVRIRDIAVGAIVTAILVMIGKSLVDWYFSAADLEPTYKAAGSFVIFLIWMYYNVQVVLIGAIFTQVYTTRYGGKVDPYWNATLRNEWYED